MGKKGRSKRKDAQTTKVPDATEHDTSHNGSNDPETVPVAAPDAVIETIVEEEERAETPSDNKSSEKEKVPTKEPKLSDDETESLSSKKDSEDERSASTTSRTSQKAEDTAGHVTPPEQLQEGLDLKRKIRAGSSRVEFLKMIMEDKELEKQLLEKLAGKTNILARLSCTSMKAVTDTSELAEDESDEVARNDHAVESFKEIHEIQLPFPVINECLVLPPHNYGEDWDTVVNRIYDSDYIEAFHLNYPRRDSVDVYAENLLWIKNLIENIARMAGNITGPGAAVEVGKFVKSREHKCVDTLVKNEFRGSFLQRVRDGRFFLKGMFDDEISISSTENQYSPYFTTEFSLLDDTKIVSAQMTLAASILFLKLTDDALHNGRLLSCVAYGHAGLSLAGKFYSFVQDQDSFNALELLFHQRLVTALYRLAIYADLGNKILKVFDEINDAFKCVAVFHELPSEKCEQHYPDTEFTDFMANLRTLKCHHYEDRQLLWERHFLVTFRSLQTINCLVENLRGVTELHTVTERNNSVLSNILTTLEELDGWEDHLSFYTCHNLAARLLHYKAQIVSFIAEFVTDYRTCYQYALSKISRAIQLERKRIPNMDVVFHRQCVNSFKVFQLDAALRLMWEIQSIMDVHHTLTLLQRVVDHRMPTWVILKKEDYAYAILASIMLIDYSSGLTNYLSKNHVKCIRQAAFDYLKDMDWDSSLRDTAIMVIWDKLEKVFLVKEGRTLEENIRLLKIAFYILPVLMYYYWADDSDKFVQMYNSATKAQTLRLAEAKESYTETKDPNYGFGQKMLHDFSQDWSTTPPTVEPQNSWPKPWKLEDTNEFECGPNRKVFFMNNKPVPRKTLDEVVEEYSDDQVETTKISRPFDPESINYGEFHSALGARTAQYVIRSNDYELSVMKKELVVIIQDNKRMKIDNFDNFVATLLFILGEIESLLEIKGHESKLPLEKTQILEWHTCVKNLRNDIEAYDNDTNADAKVLKILLHIALAFGFSVDPYVKNMLQK